ncbi:hypothetical protein A2U01_0010313, partial [Trifolium medium]|nr:hypothetical protein [Trifolium medium]
MFHLQKQEYGWVEHPNGKRCGVLLCLDDGECHMNSGRVVAREFGFVQPTEVILDYQIYDNRFSMTIIKNEDLVIVSSDDSVSDQIVISEDESVDNLSDLSDASNIVLHDFLDDRLYGWKLK